VNRFTCNLCGTECEAAPSGREVPGCPSCGSTVRLRALAALLTREILGIPLALPDLPVLKSVRGIGMSDPPALASRLDAKLDYTNTFYHQAPQLDITQPPVENAPQYDFIVSSEVMEHVPVPVEQAFRHLHALLKPDGFLLLTVPYRLDGHTTEHFPEMHEYALASPGGRTVLVNRRRDGSLEVFENLCFHGGDGSTLEMRVFSESSLKQILQDAGFAQVEIASQDIAEFGVAHAETWSLPIIARKSAPRRHFPELALAYRDACRRAALLERESSTLRDEYVRHIEHHRQTVAELERQLADRLQWLQKIEAEHEERTRWALDLEQEKDAALAEFKRLQASEAEAWQRVAAVERELGDAKAARAAIQSRLWSRVGHKLGLS